MPPVTATAIVQENAQLIETSVVLPPLEDHQILVRVIAAAFNPTDRRSFEGAAFDDGAVLGCDFAGRVTHVGPNVEKIRIGDLVAGFVWGGEVKGIGAYSTLCIADERLAFQVPDRILASQASTIPLAATTAWLGLFSRDSLGLSREINPAHPQTLLVWGGSTSVGNFAIQLASYYKIRVITTCSPRNFDNVRAAGASFAFDYNDPEILSRVSSTAPDLTHVFDTVGTSLSSDTATKCFGGRPGSLCTIMPGRLHTETVPHNVKVSDVMVFKAFLKDHIYKKAIPLPADPYVHALGKELFSLLPSLLENGDLRPQIVFEGGSLSVQSVERAFELNRAGKVSNFKIVIQVSGN